MTPLEHGQKQFLNLCVQRARAHGRQQFAVEVERLRVEMAEHVAVLRADAAAIFRQLQAAREEAALLREERAARIAHVRAQHEVLAAWRRLQIERAWQSERDPTIPLQ